MGRSEVPTSVVMWSEGLRNLVSIIIRIYIDNMWFDAYLSVFYHMILRSFVSILYHCICVCKYNFVPVNLI
jgi:hypothetical protein